ncbi:uncharacterized protein LOC119347874 [Triticum dicoccoides]|uniref:uncharacterized protein LOC119301913 n=1 Tax=Triticum dicoccoides TaxID=85692 RepID=UPI00188ECE39|nr:uncharacterized protein LOC119301913 [Triticum dicoccoides]XP_037472261.1 uncharacterized protein LOC119347874 [Triticum dicoccoides]
MARLYHLTLLSVFFLLTLTGLETADPSREKKVTMTVQFPPADSPPGEKITISTHYIDEDGVGDSHVHLDCDDHEPQLGSAVKHLVRSLEKIRDEEASLSEAYDMPSQWMQVLFHLVSGKIRRDLLYYRSIMSARSSFARANNHSVLAALSTSHY